MIAIYSPSVPREPGGVADQTLCLARALDAQGHRPLVLAGRGDASLFAPVPCETGITPSDVPEAARRAGAAVVVMQYVPFLYARRGVAPSLARLPSLFRSAGVRWAVMLHEPYVPLNRPVWWITGPLQRLQLFALLRGATAVYTPVPHYADIARRYAGRQTSVTVAPVGATVPTSTLSRDEARDRLGLAGDDVAIGVFSPAAAGFAHDWIAAAAAALAPQLHVRWVRFGFGSARRLPGYPDGARTITIGEAEPARLADTMRALDLVAAPYEDGLTLRRTGAMLALASGVATVSSTGPLYDPTAGELAACEPDADAFARRLVALARDGSARASLAQRTARYTELASVEVLARKVITDFAEVA
jgi:glycosyltransferase involved in cell wall biosynthesis